MLLTLVSLYHFNNFMKTNSAGIADYFNNYTGKVAVPTLPRGVKVHLSLWVSVLEVPLSLIEERQISIETFDAVLSHY